MHNWMDGEGLRWCRNSSKSSKSINNNSSNSVSTISINNIIVRMVQYQPGWFETVIQLRKRNWQELEIKGAWVDVKNVSRHRSKCSCLISSFLHFLARFYLSLASSKFSSPNSTIYCLIIQFPAPSPLITRQ